MKKEKRKRERERKKYEKSSRKSQCSTLAFPMKGKSQEDGKKSNQHSLDFPTFLKIIKKNWFKIKSIIVNFGDQMRDGNGDQEPEEQSGMRGIPRYRIRRG